MVTTSRILGADGQPIRLAELAEPQTARVGHLHQEWQGHPARGLTPSKLNSILIAAEQGVSLGKLLTKVHDEVLEFDEELSNFASLLRCACLNWSRIEDDPAKRAVVRAQGRQDFALTK